MWKSVKSRPKHRMSLPLSRILPFLLPYISCAQARHCQAYSKRKNLITNFITYAPVFNLSLHHPKPILIFEVMYQLLHHHSMHHVVLHGYIAWIAERLFGYFVVLINQPRFQQVSKVPHPTSIFIWSMKRCGSRCLAERRNQCRELQKWSRCLLTMIGMLILFFFNLPLLFYLSIISISSLSVLLD